MNEATTSPAPLAPPPSPEALARALTGLAARLSELMTRETALLKTGRHREIAVLQTEKRDLARAYAGRWTQLKGGDTRQLPAEVSNGLRTQLARLERATTENAAALRAMLDAINRVLGIVAVAAREHQASLTGYDGRRGRPRRQPAILGVACNQRF